MSAKAELPLPLRCAVAVDGKRLEMSAEWLAGFIDGEGSFNIAVHGGRGYQPRLRIGLRDDDDRVLRAIRAWIGGTLHHKRQNPTHKHYSPAMRDQLTWDLIGSHCLRVLPILDAAPLQSKKARDYKIWRQAVLEYGKHKGSRWSPNVVSDRDRILAKLKAELEATREYVGGNQLTLWRGNPPPVPFATVVADPPWEHGDQLPGDGRGASKHYKTIPTPDICDAKLPPIAKDAWLFLWRVASMPEDALAVARAWGFVPKSEIVWIKSKDGGRTLQMGMGHYVRNAHEACLVCARGRPERVSMSTYSTFFAPRSPRHSEKPDRFYEIVEELAPGPYLELFARDPRVGWTVFGDEVQPEAEAEARP